jgi:hypothetical protein
VEKPPRNKSPINNSNGNQIALKIFKKKNKTHSGVM